MVDFQRDAISFNHKLQIYYTECRSSIKKATGDITTDSTTFRMLELLETRAKEEKVKSVS